MDTCDDGTHESDFSKQLKEELSKSPRKFGGPVNGFVSVSSGKESASAAQSAPNSLSEITNEGDALWADK
ncbi:hypothetical protein TELCIR_22681, partial [Teladorsagia circumcincta]